MGKGQLAAGSAAPSNILAMATRQSASKVKGIMAVMEPEQLDETGSPRAKKAKKTKLTAAQRKPIKRANGQDYIPRAFEGQAVTDIEMLRSARDNATPVLLSGYPGTGKTASVEAAFGEDLVTVNGHGHFEVSELVGSYVSVNQESLRIKLAKQLGEREGLTDKQRETLEEAARQLPPWGNLPQPVPGEVGKVIEGLNATVNDAGMIVLNPDENNPMAVLLAESWRRGGTQEFEWRDGPLVTAMKEGKVLFVDDITLIPPPVLARLYSVMDGRGVIEVVEHESETVEASEGFFVVGAYNPEVVGGILDGPLNSRFRAKYEVPSDMDIAKDMGIDPAVVRAAKHMQALRLKGTVSWAPELREMIAFKENMELKDGNIEMALGSLLLTAPTETDRQFLIECLDSSFPNIGPLRLAGGPKTVEVKK